MIVRNKVDKVIIRRGSTTPVAVITRDIGTVRLYRTAVEGPRGEQGLPGMPGEANLPGVLDGGNF